ncbi:MAG: hypothetical protein A4E66_02574 [Syntrophus sp. PtaB.Bin001]|nr:MAG: hypothetical protein A4E66_02574 [Syntrophus sp. PtaB.Bin001]
MELKVPKSLRLEHLELREQLYALTKENSDLGVAARTLMELFYMHAIKEEERVLLALDALSNLAERKITDQMEALKVIAEDLKSGLYEELFEEHKAIVASLKSISQSALLQGRNEYVKFVERFIMHAQMEEEILYPASLVAAEYFQMLTQCRPDQA